MDSELFERSKRRLERLERGADVKSLELLIDEFSGARTSRDETDSQVWIYRSFYDSEDAENLMRKAQEQLPWEQHKLKIGMENRLTTLLGDPGVVHHYSGSARPTEAWHKTEAGREINQLKGLINEVFGAELNSCLGNRYRGKADYISYHSDAEIKPPNNYVFALSLGQERPFYFKRKVASEFGPLGQVIETTIRSGDLMLMEGATQKHFTHSVPKRTGKNINWGERISFTFREL